jgi:hypothetical protein
MCWRYRLVEQKGAFLLGPISFSEVDGKMRNVSRKVEDHSTFLKGQGHFDENKGNVAVRKEVDKTSHRLELLPLHLFPLRKVFLDDQNMRDSDTRRIYDETRIHQGMASLFMSSIRSYSPPNLQRSCWQYKSPGDCSCVVTGWHMSRVCGYTSTGAGVGGHYWEDQDNLSRTYS